MSAGVVLWLTGLPSSGKSTLARAVRRALRGRCVLLDSDEVRAAVFPKLGYGPRARGAFYRALAGLAALLARQGLVVLVAATANRRSYRAHARALAPRFVEVFVDTPAELCARRDPKGLWASAARLPGRGETYEPPRSPQVHVRTGATAAAVRACLAALKARARRPPRRSRRSPGPRAPRSRRRA